MSPFVRRKYFAKLLTEFKARRIPSHEGITWLYIYSTWSKFKATAKSKSIKRQNLRKIKLFKVSIRWWKMLMWQSGLNILGQIKTLKGKVTINTFKVTVSTHFVFCVMLESLKYHIFLASCFNTFLDDSYDRGRDFYFIYFLVSYCFFYRIQCRNLTKRAQKCKLFRLECFGSEK